MNVQFMVTLSTVDFWGNFSEKIEKLAEKKQNRNIRERRRRCYPLLVELGSIPAGDCDAPPIFLNDRSVKELDLLDL